MLTPVRLLTRKYRFYWIKVIVILFQNTTCYITYNVPLDLKLRKRLQHVQGLINRCFIINQIYLLNDGNKVSLDPKNEQVLNHKNCLL